MADVVVEEEKPCFLRKRTTQLNMADRLGYRLEGNLKFVNTL